jgi:hypothetical protein
MREIVVMLALALWGCERGGDSVRPDEADSDTDADADSDTDTDSDTDLPIDADNDGFSVELDCDDNDELVFPGAPEHCGDGRITDCDRESEDGLASVETLYTSAALQDVLDVAAPGSTVHLCAGTWTGNFVADEPLNLVGEGGAEGVHLVGAQKEPVLTVAGGTTLTGLTIRGGEADRGGGLRVTSGGTLVVTDCVIRDNEATDGGGVSLPSGSVASFPGTLITGNYVHQRGGGLYAMEATIDLTGAVVEGNSSYNNGGGVSLYESLLIGGTIQDNEVLGTSVFVGGAGVDASWDCALVDVVITGNLSGGPGGGLYTEGTVTVTGGSITDNRITGPYWTSGGGIATYYGDVTLEGVEILRNDAEYGGGIASDGTLRSVDCDWGEGADDNLPSDVYQSGYGEFSAPASFVCTEQGCQL